MKEELVGRYVLFFFKTVFLQFNDIGCASHVVAIHVDDRARGKRYDRHLSRLLESGQGSRSLAATQEKEQHHFRKMPVHQLIRETKKFLTAGNWLTATTTIEINNNTWIRPRNAFKNVQSRTTDR